MRIIGDSTTSSLEKYEKEPGIVFGYNDVLKGQPETTHIHIISPIWGNSDKHVTTTAKIYLHIPQTPWSTFTAIFRKYCLFWCWKSAFLEKDFLDQETGSAPLRVLVYTGKHSLSSNLQAVLGQSWFTTLLIHQNLYRQVYGNEYLHAYTRDCFQRNSIPHFLGELVGLHVDTSFYKYCHMYRKRGGLSTLRYHFLSHFSSNWKEVTLTVKNVSEKILIKKTDEATLLASGLSIS